MASKTSPEARVDVRADLRYLYRRKSAVESLIRLLEKYQGVSGSSGPLRPVRRSTRAKPAAG